MTVAYPFTAIAGQDDMKLALSIAAVDPSIGGVLVFGERGTGKSTTIRARLNCFPKSTRLRLPLQPQSRGAQTGLRAAASQQMH